MVTIFATPRTFDGHFGVIQRNAIRNWTRLKPTPQVLILGGGADAAAECRLLGVTHVPEVGCNEFGTPLIGSMVEAAEACAEFPFLMLIAADNLVLDSLEPVLGAVTAKFNRFCIVGGRSHIRLDDPIDVDDPRWVNAVRRCAIPPKRDSDDLSAGDFFLFPRGFWGTIPPFTFCRLHADGWLFYRTLELGGALVDATDVLTTVHQDHDYSDHPGGIVAVDTGPESTRNWELAGNGRKMLTREHANWLLTRRGLSRPRWTPRRHLAQCEAIEALHPGLAPVVGNYRRIVGRAITTVGT